MRPMRVLCVAIGWGLAALIVWLSVTTSPPQFDVEQGDKLGHVAAYGTLMLWFCLLYARRTTRIAYGLLWIGMGIGLEFVQRELGYRTFDLYDMCADAVGVLMGWAFSFAIPVGLAQKLR
jgi:VanZ family protein